MIRRGLLLAVVALVSVLGVEIQSQAGCPGGTCTISTTCSLGEVQNAVNSAIDGNTIQLPANTTCNWEWSLRIPSKALTIQGFGPASTRIVATGGGPLVHWTTKSTGGGAIPGIARIAHLTLDEGTGNGGENTVTIDGDTPNFIIQNVEFHFRKSLNHIGVLTTSYVRGVMQFSAFYIYGQAAGLAAIVVQHMNWQNQGHFGDYSWVAPSTLGTADAMYIEGSTFACPAGIYCNVSDADGGGRWVWRDNNFIRGASVTMHGADTPGRSARATRQFEYYFNRFADHETWAGPYPLRSGVGMIFDSQGTNLATGFMTDANYQPGDPDGLGHAPYGPFGDCRVRAVTQITCNANTLTVQGGKLSFNRDVYMEIIGNSVGAYNGIKVVASSGGGTQHNPTTVTVAQSCSTGVTGTGGFARPVGHGFAGGNSDGVSGWPCADGIGRGPGAWLMGDFPFLAVGSAYNTLQVPTVMNQALEPVRQWNVLYNGSLQAIVDRSGGAVVGNRDWFDQNNATCVAGGACTSGNGRGNTLPTTCTAAVGGVTNARTGFWLRTDSSTNWNQEDAASHARHDPTSALHPQGEDGAFYECTSTNTWTKTYTPYTLPHPLLSGIATPPPDGPPSISLVAPSSTGAYGTTAATVDFGGGCTDNVACTAITYTCTPACGSGSASGVGPWTLTGASVPLGTSVWTFTPADVKTTGVPVSITVLRRAVVTALPYTDPHTATAVYPNLGPLYTIYGTEPTQLGLTAAGTGIVNTLAFGAAAFTGFPVNADQYMDVLALDVAPLARQIRLCFRVTGTPGQTSDLDYYFVQFDGTNSATNLIGRIEDGGTVLHNYTPTGLGAVTITLGETIVGGQMIGTTLQARIDGLPVGPVIQTAGEYLTGTVANCSVGVGTRWDDTVIGNAVAIVDKVPPTVVIDVPTMADAVYPITPAMSPLTIEAAVADNVGIWSCSWVNSAAPGPTPVVPVAGRISASVTIATGSTNTITMTCQDAAGNTTSDAIPVVINVEPPPTLQRPVNLRGIFK